MEPEVLYSHAGMEDLHKCKRFPDDLISDIQNQISMLQEQTSVKIFILHIIVLYPS